MTSNSQSNSKPRKSRRLRKWVAAIVVVLIALAAVIVFAPRLAGTSLGLRVVNSFLPDSPDTRIRIRSLDLQWIGEQRIPSMTIEHDQGRVSADLSVVANGALWRLGKLSGDKGTVTIRGDVTVRQHAGAASAGATDSSNPLAMFGDDFAVFLQLDDLTVNYEPAPNSSSATATDPTEMVRLEHFITAVDFAVAGGGRLAWDANARAISGDGRGIVQTSGTLSDFINPDGVLDLRPAEIDVEFLADRVGTRLIDSTLALDDALIASAGDWITLQSTVRLNNGDGMASFNLESPNAVTDVQSNVSESRITLAAPATAELEINQRLAALIRRFMPAESGVSTSDLHGRVKLTIEDLNAGIGETGIDTEGLTLIARLEGAAESIGIEHEAIDEFGLVDVVAIIETGDLSRGLDVSLQGVAQFGVPAETTNHTIPINNARLRVDGPLMNSVNSKSIDELSIAAMLELQELQLGPLESVLAQSFADGWLVDVAGSSLNSVLFSLGHQADSDGNQWTLGMDASSSAVHVQTRAIWEEGRLHADASHDNRIEISPSSMLRRRISATIAEPNAESGLALDSLDSVVIEAESFSVDPERVAEAAFDLNVVLGGLAGSVPREMLAPVLASATGRGELTLDRGTLSLRSDNLSERITGEFSSDGLLDGESIGIESILTVDTIFETHGRSFWIAPVVRYLDSSCSLDVQLAEGPTDAVFHLAGSAALNARLLERVLPEDSIQLEGPIHAQFNIEPMSLWRDQSTGTFAWTEFWNHVPIKAHVKSAQVRAKSIPSIAQPAELSALEVDLRFPGGLAGSTLHATATGSAKEANRDIKAVNFDVHFEANRNTAGSFAPERVMASLTQVDVESMERFFARQTNEWQTWLGRNGHATIEWTRKRTENEVASSTAQMRIDADFDRLTALGSMEVQEDYFVIDPDTQVSMLLDRTFVERIFNEKIDLKNASNAGSKRFRIPADVRAHMTSRSGVIPRPKGEGLLAKVTEIILDASVIVESFDIEFVPSPNQQQSMRVSAFSFDCYGGPLPDGILFEGASTIQIASRQQPTQLNLNGAVQGETSRPIEWWFTGIEGTYENMPVAFFDGLWNTNGHLIASLGDTVNMSVNANEFGRGRGEVEFNMTSPNGTLSIDGARLGDDERIWIGDEDTTRARINAEELNFPAWASLNVTEQMSRTVLRNVSPLLFDVKKKTDPIRAEATMIRYPLDGDLARLDADVVLDLGQIDVPSRGFLNDVLGTFGAQQLAYTTTRIPPIHIKIRNGELQYDKLVLQAARFNIVTGGSINLKTRTLNLYAEPPAIGWQTFFGDFRLPGMKRESLGNLSIPFYLRIRGTVNDPKIEPDPQMARRLVEDLFDTAIRNPIFNLVNDVLRDRDRRQNQQQQPEQSHESADDG